VPSFRTAFVNSVPFRSLRFGHIYILAIGRSAAGSGARPPRRRSERAAARATNTDFQNKEQSP
jgi:hypothetical protein